MDCFIQHQYKLDSRIGKQKYYSIPAHMHGICDTHKRLIAKINPVLTTIMRY
jgi:hypothetical protein